eukprot:gene7423-5226_t
MHYIILFLFFSLFAFYFVVMEVQVKHELAVLAFRYMHVLIFSSTYSHVEFFPLMLLVDILDAHSSRSLRDESCMRSVNNAVPFAFLFFLLCCVLSSYYYYSYDNDDDDLHGGRDRYLSAFGGFYSD